MRRVRYSCTHLFGLFAMLCLGDAVMASPLPDATFTEEATQTTVGCEGDPSCTTEQSRSGPDTLTVGSASAGTSGSPILLFASSTGSGLFGSGSYAALTYDFEVVGPTDTFVPVDANYALQATVGTQSVSAVYAGADVRLTILGTMLTAFCQAEGGCVPDVSGTAHGTVATNQAIEVDLYVSAASGTGVGTGSNSAFAQADPYLYIDPSFANASAYQIVVSDGVDNLPLGASPTPVPEPAPLPLLALGMASVLCVLRRAAVA